MADSNLLPALPRPALFRGYGGVELPLPEYAALVATFGTLLAALLAKVEGGRLLCGFLSAVAGAHFLHHAYVALENRKEPK